MNLESRLSRIEQEIAEYPHREEERWERLVGRLLPILQDREFHNAAELSATVSPEFDWKELHSALCHWQHAGLMNSRQPIGTDAFSAEYQIAEPGTGETRILMTARSGEWQEADERFLLHRRKPGESVTFW